MKNNNLLSLLIIVVLIAGGYFIVQTVRQAQQAVNAPFNQVNSALQTQQANMSHLLNPTPTIIPDPVTYINEVRALARLETIQYSIEKVVTGIQPGVLPFELSEDKILFVAHGTVIAGIDMAKLQPEHMRFENGVLRVNLPPAEIFIATLDNGKSYVYQRDTGVFAQPDANLETSVRQEAERQILNAALEDGILQQAQINAEAYLFRFFAALGYPNTIFVQDPS
ncbi:MAG TPA: DUF4230 domain-containing protein [Anaerolineales bacterium]|nr:DUF4230 domain-containing protein [Anaerolineales bacterium]